MSAHGDIHGKCLRTGERTAHRETQLKALARSMSTSTQSGSSRNVLVHCLVVCTTASHLALSETNLDRLEDGSDGRTHEFDGNLAAEPTTCVSPTATGRRDPLGLRRAMRDAPRIDGQTSSETSPAAQLDAAGASGHPGNGARLPRDAKDASRKDRHQKWERNWPRPCVPCPVQRTGRPPDQHLGACQWRLGVPLQDQGAGV